MNEYIGIDIGGTKISVIRGDAAGNIIEKKKFATKTKDETLKEIFEGVSELMNEHVTSIGVSCGGPLNSKTGVILGPPNLPGWDEVPITDMLTETFGIPAYLKNDADAWRSGGMEVRSRKRHGEHDLSHLRNGNRRGTDLKRETL